MSLCNWKTDQLSSSHRLNSASPYTDHSVCRFYSEQCHPVVERTLPMKTKKVQIRIGGETRKENKAETCESVKDDKDLLTWSPELGGN